MSFISKQNKTCWPIEQSTMNYSSAEVPENVTDDISDSPRPWRHIRGDNVLTWRTMKLTLLFVGAIVMSAVLLYGTSTFYGSVDISSYFTFIKVDRLHQNSKRILIHDSISDGKLSWLKTTDLKLDNILRNASMSDRTVILTTLNDAWAEPNSVFDLFLESFHNGDETEKLLNHLVVIALDPKAYARCTVLHPHCYSLYTQHDNFTSEALFMTSDYLHMMWRRIDFLRIILEMGYNFVFTDLDVMWFRNPFKHFHKDADFQIACDVFIGDSYDRNNYPNGGFNYVRSNLRSIRFYQFWYASRLNYRDMHDQGVLNKIKKHPFITQIKLKLRFLDTAYFGGFCEPSKNFKQVCTMHANCCAGLKNKVNDLKILLEDWKKIQLLPPTDIPNSQFHWSVPQDCRNSVDHLISHQHKKGG